ncbi:unnamed protein product [Musa acuminata subsp. malaccensis]|uniref:homocysteine S-methyltransferase n=1 Tax=Musa acuminata subsp. malaccensis TaxID=214687 RepID=A0A8D7FC31_MUSAM|nr:unnamed protein product [Musa acuminata subsp. malaccensis]
MGFGSGDPQAVMREFLHQVGGCAVIDGGLATELEANGADLNDPLWSAKCLIGSPHLIRKVHLDYLEAGAHVIITSSYQQATIQGFKSRGFSQEESEDLLRRSVQIAREARDIFYNDCLRGYGGQSDIKKHTVLVAASIGSYGAYLADGSEYSGHYGKDMTIENLKDFHRRRLEVLAEGGADLIVFETIPNKLEAQAYAELLEEDNISIPAWFSFNSKDGVNVVSGDSLTECVSIADSCKKVVAVGINCTPPRFIHGLILSIKKVTKKPILIYPNSGERYDADKKEWVESTGVTDEDFVSYVQVWHEAGACLIGGCCRTTPNTIRGISLALQKEHAIPRESVP